jgi:hypothetical protein
MNRLVKALAASLTILVLAGCAQLPQSGPVKDGPDLQKGQSSDYLYYSPNGPESGQSQGDILNGFINAATGPQNDFAVAREFLTPNMAANWAPNTEVLIQEGGLNTQLGSNNKASVTLTVAASIDSSGHYSAMPSGTQRTLDFTFAKYNGQWRIASAPNAVMLIRPVFDVIYHSYSLYFFDHGFNYLVPDLRWFPSRTSTATRLVAALLDGPSDWLAGAVETTMPLDTKLAIDAVTVEKDVAQVDLNAIALQAPQSRRQYFKAQLLATLRQVTGVNRVQVLIDRSPQKIADYVPANSASKAIAPVVLSQGALRQLASPTSSQLSSAETYIEELGANQFALTADQRTVALRNQTGVWQVHLGQAGERPVLIDGRADMLDPKYDKRGSLWTISRNGDGLIQVKPAVGSPHWLQAPWLVGHKVLDFALSAEGSRIVTVVQTGGGRSQILVAAVVRNRTGVPTSIGYPIRLRVASGNPRSIDWSGENQVIALIKDATGAVQVINFSIGGDSKTLGPITNGVRVVSGDSASNVYVITASGNLVQYRGYAWSVLARKVTAAHMVN